MKKLLLIIPLFLIFSCSVQKRKYQKGFYISTNKSRSHIKKDAGIASNKNDRSNNTEAIQMPVLPTPVIETEASVNSKINLLKINKTLIYQAEPDSCDIITLKNGEDVRAHVLEITPVDIKYKKCDLPDGPLYIVKKQDVFMIRYTNGTKEVIKEEIPNPNLSNNRNAPTQTNRTYTGPKKIHPLAFVALGCLILSFLVGFTIILAPIFANIAIRKIRARPDIYKGETLAKVVKGVAIGILIFVAVIIIILLLFGA